MNIKVITALVLIFLVMLFLLQNTEVVAIRLLWWKLSMSRALMIMVVLVIGLVAGWLLASIRHHRQGHR